MSSINKRVFGTPIKGLVKDKLEARQGETKALQPNQPLYGKTISVSNYDYASRLPFVRMWTSVKLISPADVGEILEEIKVSDLENPNAPVPLYKFRTKAANKFGVKVEKTNVQEIKDKNGKVEKYLIRKGTARDQLNFNRKIYEIGNHNYLKNYGESTPNESVFEGETYKDLDFPNEGQKNPYLKPQSGI